MPAQEFLILYEEKLGSQILEQSQSLISFLSSILSNFV